MQTIDLKQTRDNYENAARTVTRRIIICAGTGCMANGAMKVHARFVAAIAKAGLPVTTELKAEDTSPGKIWSPAVVARAFARWGPSSL